MLAKGFADFDVLVLDIGEQIEFSSIDSPARCQPVFIFCPDIKLEGTVCPITFVHDVLFPYALKVVPQFLDKHWDSPDFSKYRNAFPQENRNDRAAFESHIHDLVARDVKAPYLKALQGLLWKTGYQSGELKAPIFPDVAPFISAAHSSGKKIIIYSSGSIAAQKLFFAHTTDHPSDLSHLISGWFDTVNAGPKTESKSYTTILSSHPCIKASRWLFLSDNLNEVTAALSAGMQSLPVSRPGNSQLPEGNPLTNIAIPDFSPESDDKIQQSLAALEGIGIS